MLLLSAPVWRAGKNLVHAAHFISFYPLCQPFIYPFFTRPNSAPFIPCMLKNRTPLSGLCAVPFLPYISPLSACICSPWQPVYAAPDSLYMQPLTACICSPWQPVYTAPDSLYMQPLTTSKCSPWQPQYAAPDSLYMQPLTAPIWLPG